MRISRWGWPSRRTADDTPTQVLTLPVCGHQARLDEQQRLIDDYRRQIAQLRRDLSRYRAAVGDAPPDSGALRLVALPVLSGEQRR